jgi:hypothetical protein
MMLEKKITVSSELKLRLDKYFSDLCEALLDKENRYSSSIDEKFLIENIPSKSSGIYCIFLNDNPVYVGKSRELRNRLRQHFVKNHQKTSSMHERVCKHRKRVTLSFIFCEETLLESAEIDLITKLSQSATEWWGRRK